MELIIEVSPHNPFQAPEADTKNPGLAPDIEFLVSDECILCGDEIILPAVCIQTGRKTDLVKKSATLKWGPPLVTKLFVIMLLFVCPIVSVNALGAMRYYSRLMTSGTSWTDILLGSAMFGAIGITAFLLFLTIRLKRNVQLTWFIQQQTLTALQKKVARRRILGGLSLLVGIFIILVAVYVTAEVGGFAFVPLLFAALFFATSREKIDPVFAGRHEGLNILSGLSPEFLKEIQEIIDRHNAQFSNHGED